MKRDFYFATGSAEQASLDLKPLCAAGGEASLLVVAPSAIAPQLERFTSHGVAILVFRPSSILASWIRLTLLLASSPDSRILCPRSSGQNPLLKLLALTLPGKLFVPDGRGGWSHCSRVQLWRAAVAAQGPLCVIGTASPERLAAIAANLRERYPEVRLHGVLPVSSSAARELFDSCYSGSAAGSYLHLLPQCFGRRRFRALVLPCTNEGFLARKCLAWMTPVWRIEAYNEFLGVFSGRSPFALARHLWWRTRENCLATAHHLGWLWWRAKENRVEKRRERQKAFESLPVSVLGAASGLSLRKIVPAVRAAFPGMKLHGFFPAETENAPRDLFDAITILRPGLWSTLVQLWTPPRQHYQCCVIPCTNEPYQRLKLVAALAPLGPRHIYNEMGDGFPVRQTGTFVRHIQWRLRDHWSFQIAAGTRDKHFLSGAAHLVLYAGRLLAGAALLAKVRLGAIFRERFGRAADGGVRSANRNTVDLIRLDTGSAAGARQLPPNLSHARLRSSVTLEISPELAADVEKINAAIRNGQAEFICLLDSRCRLEGEDWLDRLIETFDAQTGQVGPQIIRSSQDPVRGGLLQPDREPRWNSDHAVCWHTRPEWLQVEALPWTCLVLRRRLFEKVGYLGNGFGHEPLPVDLDFCRRLAAHGWRSICNESVTAFFPAGSAASEMETAGEISWPLTRVSCEESERQPRKGVDSSVLSSKSRFNRRSSSALEGLH